MMNCLVTTSGSRSPMRKENRWKHHGWANHGMFHWHIGGVADIEKPCQWVEKAGLEDSTEALTMAAQGQPLSTSSVDAEVYHTSYP